MRDGNQHRECPLVDPRETLFHELLTSHGAALRRIAGAYATGNDGADADDLHQEILLQVWRGLPGFRGEAAPGTWLYRVALNTALSWRRRGERHLALEQRHAVRPEISAGEPETAEMILHDFLAVIAPVDRSVLIPYLDGLSYQAIAEITGLSAGAVGVRLHRLKQDFTRRYLEEAR